MGYVKIIALGLVAVYLAFNVDAITKIVIPKKPAA